MQKTKKSSSASLEQRSSAQLENQRREIIGKWLGRYTAHYAYELLQEDTEAWLIALKRAHPDDLDSAFERAMNECRFDGRAARPRAADVRDRIVPDAKRVRASIPATHLIPEPGCCFEKLCPETLRPGGREDFLCGCRDHAPQLYCQHGAECERLGVVDINTGKRMAWCARHSHLHDGPQKEAESNRESFRDQIRRMAAGMAMLGSEAKRG